MEEQEEYWKRAILAMNRPINPMSKTPNIDKVINLTGLIVERRQHWEFVNGELNKNAVPVKSLREIFAEKTSFFNDPCLFDTKHEDNYDPYFDEVTSKLNHSFGWYKLSLELDNELRKLFQDRNEYILQNRDASYLAVHLVSLILPTVRFEWKQFIKYLPPYALKYAIEGDGFFFDTPNSQPERDNMFFTMNLRDALISWASRITDYIHLYAPDVFEQHRIAIDFYFNNRQPEINFSDINRQTNESSKPTQPDAKNQKETYTKDQVLLLNELGIFEIPAIKNLTTENKGKLFARLLNRNEKNVTEYIRNCDSTGNKQAEDNPYIYENKVATIKQLLTDIGFFANL